MCVKLMSTKLLAKGLILASIALGPLLGPRFVPAVTKAFAKFHFATKGGWPFMRSSGKTF
jgi:hypothetical protein